MTWKLFTLHELGGKILLLYKTPPNLNFHWRNTHKSISKRLCEPHVGLRAPMHHVAHPCGHTIFFIFFLKIYHLNSVNHRTISSNLMTFQHYFFTEIWGQFTTKIDHRNISVTICYHFAIKLNLLQWLLLPKFLVPNFGGKDYFVTENFDNKRAFFY